MFGHWKNDPVVEQDGVEVEVEIVKTVDVEVTVKMLLSRPNPQRF